MQQNKKKQNRQHKRTNNNHRAIIVWKQTNKESLIKPTCKIKQNKQGQNFMKPTQINK